MKTFDVHLLNQLPAMILCPGGAWVHSYDANKEINRLQAIVDKIPKLANGEPAIIGEKVFVRWSSLIDHSSRIVPCTIVSFPYNDIAEIKVSQRNIIEKELSVIYKTRQAAEQAGITDKEARKELTVAIQSILGKWPESKRTRTQLELAVKKYGTKQEN